MKLSIRYLIALLCITPLLACSNTASKTKPGLDASTEVNTAISQKFSQKYGQDNIKVLSVKTTPIENLYEVVVTGNQLIYTDAKANYILFGNLIDINTEKSLTEERMAEINKIDFAKLPLQQAIKEVRGNGKRTLVVFSDPDCPFCKRQEHEFEQITDVTIYTFLMPIPSLHPDATRKAVQIWCQTDPSQAWTQWMRKGVAPKAVATCPNPVEKNMALGEELGLNSTPTLIFPNGKISKGAMPKDALNTALDENQK